MTQRELAALVCKALGIYFFVIALTNFPNLLIMLVTVFNGSYSRFGPSPLVTLVQTLLSSVPALIFLGVSLYLWFRADGLAGKMVKNPEGQMGTLGLGGEGKSLVFSALGLWTLVQVIPKVGQIFLRLFLFSRQEYGMRLETRGMEMPDIFAILIQLGLGLWLFFGASTLAGMALGVGKAPSSGSEESNNGG